MDVMHNKQNKWAPKSYDECSVCSYRKMVNAKVYGQNNQKMLDKCNEIKFRIRIK